MAPTSTSSRGVIDRSAQNPASAARPKILSAQDCPSVALATGQTWGIACRVWVRAAWRRWRSVSRNETRGTSSSVRRGARPGPRLATAGGDAGLPSADIGRSPEGVTSGSGETSHPAPRGGCSERFPGWHSEKPRPPP